MQGPEGGHLAEQMDVDKREHTKPREPLAELAQAKEAGSDPASDQGPAAVEAADEADEPVSDTDDESDGKVPLHGFCSCL